MTGISEEIRKSATLLSTMADDARLADVIGSVAKVCVTALKNGGKILFMGNGGSAADSQHLAGELVSRFAYDRAGLASFALTTDTSVLTAIGNDYGYELLFARQIQAVGRPGDVVFGLSTSGRSANVLSGLEAARSNGLVTVGMTGNQRGRIVELVDHVIEIPSESTPRIQEGHIVVGHLLCGLIEERMFPRS